MRFRRAVAVGVTSFLVLVGAAVPASASIRDQLTMMTVDNLALVMQTFAVYDNDRSYAGVTQDDLRRWGWTSADTLAVQVVIEDGGASFWAVAQDTRGGSLEYTVELAGPVGGIRAYTVRPSDPQPPAVPATPGVQIRGEGDLVDTTTLAAALLAAGVTSEQLCAATLAVPGTHLARSSLSDQTIACETAVAAGLGLRAVLNQILRAGGAAVLASLAVDFVGDGTAPAAAPSWVGSPQGRDTTTTPRPAPPRLPDSIWHIGRLAARIALVGQLDEPTARVVAEQCLAQVANAFTGLDPYRACQDTPIFASGRADVPEATQHDTEALARNPAWVALNYRKRSENPGREQWYRNDPVCQAKGDGQDCDEFPFYATEQGGGTAVPRPSLKAVDSVQNRDQGQKYWAFLRACGLDNDRGLPFLAVPIPASAPSVPTLAICS